MKVICLLFLKHLLLEELAKIVQVVCADLVHLNPSGQILLRHHP